MNYSDVFSAEISHWTQMETSIQYNTVYTKVIKHEQNIEYIQNNEQ